jgi:hypothetical protein
MAPRSLKKTGAKMSKGQAATTQPGKALLRRHNPKSKKKSDAMYVRTDTLVPFTVFYSSIFPSLSLSLCI